MVALSLEKLKAIGTCYALQGCACLSRRMLFWASKVPNSGADGQITQWRRASLGVNYVPLLDMHGVTEREQAGRQLCR